MMVETSPPANAPQEMGEERAEDKQISEETPQEEDENQSAAEPPKPRKTWALPKAPPPGSQGPSKKTLMDIMAEEEQTSEAKRLEEARDREKRLAQEEEEALRKATQASLATSGNEAEEMDEDMKLAMMLSMQDQNQAQDGTAAAASAASTSVASKNTCIPPVAAAAAAAASATTNEESSALTEEEMKEIEKALQEADADEHAKSLQLAMELQQQEEAVTGKMAAKGTNLPQGNVRTISRQDFLQEQGKGHELVTIDYDDDYDFDDLDDNGMMEAGYRINSARPSAWLSTSRATVIGPNQELRTKHDPKLQAQANAYRLEVRADDETGERAHVGNKAYNAFKSKMQRKTVKGVAAHGHGRATADADKTREGALDGRVRLQIARAVNNGLIEDFHGCVKEGKEALVFHAEKGKESEGFDVAVKVFKRITEFKNRGEYVTGDPRYGDGKNFRNAKARQQVEIWAEKEHRNLVRAYRAKVPVPRPLWTKENVLFLRFLGEEGWPSPQLRELDIKKGSKKWTALYEQTLEAMQKLYCDGRLVHGDLSEYNILVCPAKFLKRFSDDIPNFDGENGESKKEVEEKVDEEDAKMPAVSNDEDQKPAAIIEVSDQKQSAKKPAHSSTETILENIQDDDELQVALIDFGQAVDHRHPEAEALLQRDITRVKQFFDRMGITTVGVENAMAYVQTKGAPLRAAS